MRSGILFLGVIFILFSIGSCRKDFDVKPNQGKLEFSKDTIFLDTIFSNIGSSTYNLKVYNRSNNDLTIPKIKLKNGVNSNYRLNVDGIPGKEFNNIDILAKDSIYIFIETTIDHASLSDPLYTDKLLFDNGDKEQIVDLVTLVKDAHFIYPDKNGLQIETLVINGEKTDIQGRFLKDSELIFTAEKPYVIYGYAAIPSGKTLTIEEGTAIHFHESSGLIVDRNAQIKANGSIDKKIIFQGDRLEHRFDDVPSQWGTIWIRSGSTNNQFNNVLIKNAVVGTLVEGFSPTPSLTIQNCEIYDSGAYGLFARNSNIIANNLVIGDAGQSSLACTHGGKYNFTHATFANNWSQGLRELPAVIINNHFTYTNDDGVEVTEIRDLMEANFTNSIIDGNSNIELVLDKLQTSLFNYNFKNCLIQFNDINDNYDAIEELNFKNSVHYQNNILNGNPAFKNINKNKFSILKDSDAINKGIRSNVSEDIVGNSRNTRIDIGAYQFVEE